jgi:IS5 family transposase
VTDWPSCNRSLVRRGDIPFSHGFLDERDAVLAKMNENKKGRKFVYSDSFILAVGCVRIYFHLPYRQTEGIIKATGKNLPSHPSYGHICKRVNKLSDGRSSVSGINKSNSGTDGNDLVIAVDSTGIKITNRGQWMTDKWGRHDNNNKKKKGYLKIHIAVDIKTKEILALEVTDEKVHDGKEMKALVERVLERNKDFKIKAVLADGAYDSNENFKCLQEKRIRPGIKVRKNSIITRKNNRMRNGEVGNQTRDLLKWKRKRKYGHRWMAETVFSSIKRMFGEHVSSTRFQNMVKEMVMKVSLYNLFKRLA